MLLNFTIFPWEDALDTLLCRISGGDNKRETSVICNGALINTIRSFYSVVDALRLYNMEGARPYYWIDQICIDQQDIREREAQVQTMGENLRESSRLFGIPW